MLLFVRWQTKGKSEYTDSQLLPLALAPVHHEEKNLLHQEFLQP